MEMQLSLFECDLKDCAHTEVQDAERLCETMTYPGTAWLSTVADRDIESMTIISDYTNSANHQTNSHTKHNYRKGGEQTVFPIKKMEELEAMATWLYKNADRKYLLGFVLGINLGLRANELLGLRTSDIFNKDGSIKYIEDREDTSDRIPIFQSKTDKVRGVYLNEVCVAVLKWYYPQGYAKDNKNDFIFSSREGGHVGVDMFRKILKEAAAACGLKQNIGTHTLRKTWGWWQYTTNTGKVYGDVSQLQRLFGHDSSMTTLRYLGIMDQEDKALYHSLNLDVAGKLIAE